MFGGRSSDGNTKGSLHYIDLTTLQVALIKTTNASPAAREGHSMNAYKKTLLVFGGCEGGEDDPNPFNDINIFHTSSKHWESPNTKGTPPAGRDGHAAGILGHYLLIYGGMGFSRTFDDMHALNLKNYEWRTVEQRGQLPGPRESMASATTSKKLYVFGGNISAVENQDEFSADFFEISFNGEIAQCRKINYEGVEPPKRISASLSNLNNKYLILFGGELDGKSLKDTWVFDLQNSHWLELQPFNSIKPRMTHVACAYKNELVVFGGMNDSRKTLSDLAVLHFGSSKVDLGQGTASLTSRQVALFVGPRNQGSQKPVEFQKVISECEKCRHSSSICEITSQFPSLKFPVLNYSPVLHFPPSLIENMTEPYKDEFTALLKISETFGKVNIISKGIVNGNLVIEIHSASYSLTPTEMEHIFTGKMVNRLISPMFKLSDINILVSRTPVYSVIALITKEKPAMLMIVIDNDGRALYPNEPYFDLARKNFQTVSHMNLSNVQSFPMGLTAILHAKGLVEDGSEIFHGNVPLSALMCYTSCKATINGNAVEKKNLNFDKVMEKERCKFYKAAGDEFFSLVVLYKDKVIYWELKPPATIKRRRGQDVTIVVETSNEDLVTKETGLLKWGYPSMRMFYGIDQILNS